MPRIPQKVAQRIDRRRFLVGAGGAILALPMLEAHAPRVAFGQNAAPPQRLIVILHSHGRVVGGSTKNGAVADNWSPRPDTGPLPETGDISPQLAALGDIRNEIVTIDQVDNIVRHMTGDADGHKSAEFTCLTCAVPEAAMQHAGGPSADYVAGLRLRASESQRTNILFPSAPVPSFVEDSTQFRGANGTAPAQLKMPPRDVAEMLFAGVQPSGMTDPPPPTAKTLAERMAARRPDILDAVAKDFIALEKKVGASDRARLEQHAEFLKSLRTQVAGGGGGSLAPTEGCSPPDLSMIPTESDYADDSHDWTRGFEEATMWKHSMENMVQAIACDITRVGGMQWILADAPVFPTEFDGTSPFDGDANWHAIIHDTDSPSGAAAPNLTKAFQYYGKAFTHLVQRLASIADVDGSRLLDNTLVVWGSDLGYGTHASFNHPIVMAGMGSKFGNGQGRHLVCEGRRSLGDFWAQVLRMLGGSDTTFGATGKVGDSGVSGENLIAVSGAPDFIESSTPLHLGELDL